MAHEEAFNSLNGVIVSFIESTDAMKESVDATPEASLMIGQWQKCDELEQRIKNFKIHSDGLSGSCTKLSVIDISTMPSTGLQSLFDEILRMCRGVISAVMILFSSKLSRPLFDEVHRLAKAELTQVHGLVVAIHTGLFDTCMTSIGQVWEMNEAIQKLPLTNKVAYKRALMGVLSVVKDTHREFQEARDESVELNKNKTLCGEPEDNCDSDQDQEQDGCMDEGWGVMNEDDDSEGFSPEEIPYVNCALSAMEKSFTTIKVTMDVMTLLSEHASANSVFSVDNNSLLDVQRWVANVFNIDLQFSASITDLGMELYAPLSLETLRVQFDIAYGVIKQVWDKLLEAEAFCKENSRLHEEIGEKLKSLVNGTKEMLNQLDLEKMCFISV